MKQIIIITLLFLGALSCTKETYVEGLDNNMPSNTGNNNNNGPVTTDEGLFTIKSQWKGTFLHTRSQQVVCEAGSYQWKRLNIKGTTRYYFKDPASGSYLAVNASGEVTLSDQQNNASLWILSQVDNNSTLFRIASYSKASNYINIETGPVKCGPILSGWLSAQWIISK
jgi:hypothetical protein